MISILPCEIGNISLSSFIKTALSEDCPKFYETYFILLWALDSASGQVNVVVVVDGGVSKISEEIRNFRDTIFQDFWVIWFVSRILKVDLIRLTKQLNVAN